MIKMPKIDREIVDDIPLILLGATGFIVYYGFGVPIEYIGSKFKRFGEHLLNLKAPGKGQKSDESQEEKGKYNDSCHNQGGRESEASQARIVRADFSEKQSGKSGKGKSKK